MKRFLCFLVCLFPSVVHAADNKVIASIKPLHSLVAAVMEGTGDTPMLLVEGSASPHTYNLKPSQAAALQKADIVFTISDDFEIFLKKPLAGLPKKVTRVALDRETVLTFLMVRQNEDFDAHEHEDEHETAESKDNKEGENKHEESSAAQKKKIRDLHYWLRTDNATAIVMEIARQLSIAYPDKRKTYLDNARKISARIKQMKTDLEVRVGKARNKPFIVFHDAFQYFEADYGLKAAGSITVHAGEMPGAKHIGELREKIKKLGAVCVFREPSFDGKVVENLVAGTGAKTGVLDAEGAALTPGPELYFQLIEGIAKGLESCLL